MPKEAVIEARKQDLSLTMQDIATHLCVSREYVRQVLTNAGLPRRAIKSHCKLCLKPLTSIKKAFCSNECDYAAHHILVKCSYCGKEFYRRKSKVERATRLGYKLAFCNRKCLGSWKGRECGFGAHPENMAVSKRTWDYAYVARLREQPLSYELIHEVTGIPLSSICYILGKMGLTGRRVSDGREVCPKCRSTQLSPNSDGDLECLCGQIVYTRH